MNELIPLSRAFRLLVLSSNLDWGMYEKLIPRATEI
jgi:hypothetical protein